MEYTYNVAGHRFSIQADEGDYCAFLPDALAHYAPFSCGATASEACDEAAAPVFRLTLVPEPELPEPSGLVEEFTQDDDGSQIRIARTPDGRSWFEFSLLGELSGRMLAAPDFSSAVLLPLSHPDFALNNALMVMYAMSTARRGTALFHAAVIGHGGRGYLFLGKSGTGKSTHTFLWYKNIPGCDLMNDDNPVVRIVDGQPVIYGTPWSGKTPCYRNMELPLGGFVQLAQAPHNEIRRLKGITAYAALVPSISGKRWDKAIADGLHETENALASTVPVWHLDCLPDEAAARLCAGTITV